MRQKRQKRESMRLPKAISIGSLVEIAFIGDSVVIVVMPLRNIPELSALLLLLSTID